MVKKAKLTNDREIEKQTAKLTFVVTVLFSTLCALSILWDFMIICTIMYFHTIPEKVIGTSIAVSVWFIVYKKLYQILPLSNANQMIEICD